VKDREVNSYEQALEWFKERLADGYDKFGYGRHPPNSQHDVEKTLFVSSGSHYHMSAWIAPNLEMHCYHTNTNWAPAFNHAANQNNGEYMAHNGIAYKRGWPDGWPTSKKKIDYLAITREIVGG
jgi:hypothetical protein